MSIKSTFVLFAVAACAISQATSYSVKPQNIEATPQTACSVKPQNVTTPITTRGLKQCSEWTYCQEGDTCCPTLLPNRVGCCGLPNAVCCTNGDFCCPHGFFCGEDEMCSPFPPEENFDLSK